MVRIADRLGVPWSMVYSGRRRVSLPFVDELVGFGDRVRVRTDAEHGLPTAAKLLDGVDVRAAVYVCGPPAMVEVIRRGIAAGSGTEVHVELFSPLPPVDGSPFEFVLARGGEVVPVTGDQSALAALLAVRPHLS